MVRTEDIVDALGGGKALGRKIGTLDDLREQLRAGLPTAALDAVMAQFNIARTEASAALNLPLRTIARRKHERRLRSDESDRLFRLARTAAHAAQVLGSREKAARWLHEPNRALGDQPPLLLLDSDLGARQVEEVLGRIEHGVFS